MIGAEHIRAARAYLGWSQDDLAAATGLSATTIRNLESGQMSPRATTMTVIRGALESSGIEFIEGGGVRRRHIDVAIFQGPNSADEFFAHVLRTVRDKGGDIVAVFRSCDLLAKACDIRSGNLGRLDALSRQAAVKCLLPDALDPSWSCEAVQFRSVLRPHLGPVSYLIYGDRHAILLADGPALRFLAFGSASVAADYRAHFLSLWDMAAHREFGCPPRRAQA